MIFLSDRMFKTVVSVIASYPTYNYYVFIFLVRGGLCHDLYFHICF